MASALLIVDDIQGIHEMLDIVFEHAHHEVAHALNAEQALDICRNQNVAVALVDIGLVGMNGLQLLGEIKALDPAAVVMIMTAADSKQMIIDALRAGAFDYIEKPFDEEDLRERVNRAFRERERMLQFCGGVAFKPEEIHKNEHERRQLAKEVQVLRRQLADRDARLQEWQDGQRDIEKRLADVEIKEGALKSMEAAMRERMQKLKQMQPQQRLTRPSFPVQSAADMSTETGARIDGLGREFEEREANLRAREAHIAERETFVQQSEESLFEKGQRLQEFEAELEQQRDDLEQQGGHAGLSGSEREEIESMREELKRKEDELRKLEQQLHEKGKSMRKADRLIKVREDYLAQTEKILFGDQDNP